LLDVGKPYVSTIHEGVHNPRPAFVLDFGLQPFVQHIYPLFSHETDSVRVLRIRRSSEQDGKVGHRNQAGPHERYWSDEQEKEHNNPGGTNQGQEH
jgi:hypothetical protein